MGQGGFDDEEDLGFGEPLPAPDRLWRHPAEMGAQQAAANMAARRQVGRRWPTMIVSFIAGASAVGFVWLVNDAPRTPPVEVTMNQVSPLSYVMVEGPQTEDTWAAGVAELNRGSIVRLSLEGPVANPVAHGFLYRDDGHIISSAHAVAGATNVWAELADGRGVPAEVVATDSVSGIAVIKVNSTELPVAAFSDRGVRIAIQDKLVGIATDSQSREQLVQTVSMLNTERVVTMPNGDLLSGLFQISSELDPHWGGSPIVDDQGGVVAMAVVGADGTNHAIPAVRARAIADDLIETGTTEHRSWLGVHIAGGLSERLKEERGLSNGVLIVRVFTDTPASSADLAAGDVIVAVNGVSIEARDAFGQILRAAQPGEEIEIQYSRLMPPEGPTSTNDEPSKYESELLVTTVVLGAQPRL